MSDTKWVDLEELLDEEITVQLKGGRKFQGTLTQFDDYMNLALKNAKEYKQGEPAGEHEIVVIKGGNLQTITA